MGLHQSWNIATLTLDAIDESDSPFWGDCMSDLAYQPLVDRRDATLHVHGLAGRLSVGSLDHQLHARCAAALCRLPLRLLPTLAARPG